ncbi:cupin domain-containing protein [Mycobacterium camsae]|uniref:cupin domain-containing protein n=1 Tax=Mycobacterium gordonae TaxID=1778 RepID=UPI001F119C49|nr:cupin domain-containing protein [Mycobacterium gordonae]
MTEESARNFVSLPDGTQGPLSAPGGRLLITGIDAAGRSCAAQDGPVTLNGFPGYEGILFAVLYATPSAPAISPGGRAADALDLGVPPSSVNWKLIDYGPGVAFSMHHTDTVDLDLVLSGSVELVLGDGAHPLQVGDAAVVTGVDHAWRTGPDGCRLSVMSVGVSAETSSTAT